MNLDTTDILVRVGLAFLAGTLVGLDRESHGRAAGLRTTILVCVASALTMILAIYISQKYSAPNGAWQPDPGRFASGILAGMGFIGAGSILHFGHTVRGVTTAAMLWFVTALGLAFGAGYLELGTIGLGISLLTLTGLGYLENFIKNDDFATLTVTTGWAGPVQDEIRDFLVSIGVTVKTLDYEADFEKRRRVMCFEVRIREADTFKILAKVNDQYSSNPGVMQIKWNE